MRRYTGPGVTISANHVETFCHVIANQNEFFESIRTKDVQDPMDFVIVTGRQVNKSDITTPYYGGH